MATDILTHLMFDGAAEEAMNFYVNLFPGSEILSFQHYESGDSVGKLQHGKFTLNGRPFVCIDSPVKHDFGFTPAISIYVECLFQALSKAGTILMPVDNYGFSTQFGWINDRFGVSWQLNLA